MVLRTPYRAAATPHMRGPTPQGQKVMGVSARLSTPPELTCCSSSSSSAPRSLPVALATAAGHSPAETRRPNEVSTQHNINTLCNPSSSTHSCRSPPVKLRLLRFDSAVNTTSSSCGEMGSRATQVDVGLPAAHVRPQLYCSLPTTMQHDQNQVRGSGTALGSLQSYASPTLPVGPGLSAALPTWSSSSKHPISLHSSGTPFTNACISHAVTGPSRAMRRALVACCGFGRQLLFVVLNDQIPAGAPRRVKRHRL